MGVLDRSKQEVPIVDPAVFGSELARKIAWTPLMPKEGSSGCSYRLHIDEAGSPTFVSTVFFRKIQFWHLLVAGALEVGIVALVLFCAVTGLPQGMRLIFLGFIAVSAAGGVFAFRHILKPFQRRIVFSREEGAYFRCDQDTKLCDVAGLESYTRFRDIAALQLLEKYTHTNQGHCLNYELNLIRHDGSRVAVVSHGDYDRLRHDAEALAQTFGVPLWDAGKK